MEYDYTENKKNKKGCLKWFLIIVSIFVALILIIAIASTSENNDTTTNETNITEKTNDDKLEKNEQPDKTPKNKNNKAKTWNISTKIDEMTDTQNIWATIRSDNYINQNFPYNGDTYAKITIRYMQKYGYDAIIEIDRGQIVGSDINGSNIINVRFDDEAPRKYYFNESSTYKTEIVFLQNVNAFMEKCKVAHKIKIEIPIFDYGNPLFTFTVDEPLVWPGQQ